MRRALLAAIAAFVVALSGAVSSTALGAWEDFAAHPSILAQPASGQTVKDLAVKDGELYMGYGDYSANTGPIDVATVDLGTGAYAVKATALSEEINTYRSYGGKLYVPWIDPTVVGGIHSSDQNGSWGTFGPDVENVHIFDVAVLPNGVQVAVGSANSADRSTFLGATAFVSRDNGATWKIEQTDLTSAKDPNVSGFERYYWVTVINGKAYMQARDNYAAYGQVVFPIRVFDGVRWSSVSKSADCFSAEGHLVETYAGKAYCSNGQVFNGKRTTTSGGTRAADFHQHGGSLYALEHGGAIKRLDGSSWTQIGVAPAGARSLAVTDAHIYVGLQNGHVSRALR